MNLITLEEARKLCSPIAQAGGVCTSAPILDARINEAIRRLSRMAKVPELTAVLHVLVEGNTLTLPREVKSVLGMVNVDLDPARLRHIGYEFSLSGPGEEMEGTMGPISLIALPGWYPTFFPLPKDREMSLAAFTKVREAGATTARVFGRKENGEELREDDKAGEDLNISTWKGGIEGEVLWNNTSFSTPIDQVERLILPARQGYLTLLAFDESTYESYFLGKYHPEDTRPAFRRYRLRGVDCCEEHCVSLVVKLHPPTVVYPEDPLPIQNIDALKQMVMGINAENSRDQAGALNYFAMAKGLLVSEMSDLSGEEEAMPQVKDDYDYGGTSLCL